MHATEFLLSCRKPSCLSFHRILLWSLNSYETSCGAQNKVSAYPCHVWERTSYSWSSLCNLNQGDLPLRFQEVNLLASMSTKQRLDCSENRSEVATNLPNWSPWSETGYSMDNWQNCLKAFGKNQQAKSPRAVCALPEQTFCSVHQSASSCLHWHSKCLASDEPPDFRASTSACKRLASDRAASSSLANIICQSANLRISRHKQSYKRNRLCSTHRYLLSKELFPALYRFVANSESAGDASWFERQNARVWKTNKNQDSYHLRLESHNLAALILKLFWGKVHQRIEI